MRFTPNQPVLDGASRYEADVEYDDVPEDRVKHMVSHGWGTSPDIQPEPGAWSEPAAAVTLQPHSVSSASESEMHARRDSSTS
jgi:hypothetical protein